MAEGPTTKKKLCECGCGKAVRNRFVQGHNSRGKHSGNWKGGVSRYVGKYRDGEMVAEHVLVAERALGRSLPDGAQVHHVNGDGRDNRPSNLVVCEDREYHALLHMRQRAFQTCGHADWLWCYFCQSYDAPENLQTCGSGSWAHRECRSEYWKQYVKRGRRPK